MTAPRKRKSPGGHARARKKGTRTSSFYPSAPVSVKRLTDIGMVCGICSYHREKGNGRHAREYCAFLGESVRAGDACKVDPYIQAVMS